MRVLVLGGYGLIGLEVMRELVGHGIAVVGLGRSAGRGRRLMPEAEWIGADLATLTTPQTWADHLRGFDGVVNAAGALQSGGRDNVSAVQRDAIRALIGACESTGVANFVQISAPGADAAAGTEFLRTKGEADDALRASALDWVILRPGLVISNTAYGGSSLLRMLAAVPWVQPLVLAEARLQTVDMRDVARAVARSLTDPVLARRQFDLVEPEERTLRSVVLDVRRWLGFPAPRRVLVLPSALGFFVAKLADIAGRLGWRSPLRTTALRVLADNVTGDAEPWRDATGETLSTLPETLARLPSSRQERLYARAQLVFPLAVAVFALFWIASGVIGFLRHDAAVAVIAHEVGPTLATWFVHAGSALDVLIGLGALVHRTFRASCLAAIVLSLGYLAAGTVVTPELWADPLGSFVKVLPAIALAGLLAAMAEER